MENSKIEWTDHTVNLWWGCSKVHTGCKNCYAETLSKRFKNDIWGENTNRKLIKSSFDDLKKRQNSAKKRGVKDKVFVGSMMDIFEQPKDYNNSDSFTGLSRQSFFRSVESGEYENLIFLLLTKRPENIRELCPTSWQNEPPKNVWFGTSISSQDTVVYSDILKKQLNTNNLFLSIEPQVSFIERINLDGIGWVIQGGESGNKKRLFDTNWARHIRDLCEIKKVPYFFKQIDKIQAIPKDLQIRQFPNF
jgi:protein gp37